MYSAIRFLQLGSLLLILGYRPLHATDITSSKISPSETIFVILSQKLDTQHLDEEDVFSDLQALAEYYGQFDVVTALFRQLEGRPWRIVLGPTHRAEVHTNRMSITAVSVHTNIRLGMQIKRNQACYPGNPYCFIAPADALLHEFLHAYTVLNNPTRYIQQGGLSDVLYPYEHEFEVLEQEAAMFEEMTATDGLPRPTRHHHTGHPFNSACVTCLSDAGSHR